jgi:hypothetical protein
MRDYLDRLTEVSTFALFIDDVLVYTARCYVISLRSKGIQVALVVTKIEVGLCTIFGNVALTVLIRIQRTRIDVDIRIEFLNCCRESTGLEQLSQARLL